MTADERLIIEAECLRRIKSATAELREQNAELGKKLRQAELRAAIAEWAVAGVLSRNLRLNVGIDGTALAQARQDAIEMARHLGANAGRRFLHDARLAFVEHAEFSRLKLWRGEQRGFSPYVVSADPNETEVEPGLWPRAFP